MAQKIFPMKISFISQQSMQASYIPEKVTLYSENDAICPVRPQSKAFIYAAG